MCYTVDCSIRNQEEAQPAGLFRRMPGEDNNADIRSVCPVPV